MIATDLIGCVVESASVRGRVRVVESSSEGLWLYVEDTEGYLRGIDVFEERPRVVTADTSEPVTAATLTREHIDAVRRAAVLSSSEISIAEVDLADEDRTTTAVAKVVAAYNRIAGGGK